MKRGLAIVNMLIFVLVFSLLAGTMLGLMSSSTRQVEANVRRIRGWYAAEAANVIASDRMRKNQAVAATLALPWSINPGTGAVAGTAGVNVTTSAAGANRPATGRACSVHAAAGPPSSRREPPPPRHSRRSARNAALPHPV